MQDLHPALSHYPLALLLLSVVFDALGYALKRPSLHTVGFWNLFAGVIGGLPAAYTGFIAERNLFGDSIPADLMGSHRESALLALGVFTALLLYRLIRRSDLTLGGWSAPTYLTAAIVGGGIMAGAGQSGNLLVFEAAAGVMPPEQPVAVALPEAPASRQAIWIMGQVSRPAYHRPSLSPASARLAATGYLRKLTPGKPLLRVRNGCKELHVPLLHEKQKVAGVRLDPATGRLLTRLDNPCIRVVKLGKEEVTHASLQSIRELRVGPTAWQGGHGAYWNVPLVKNGLMIDILRINVRDGTLVPPAIAEATDE